MSFGDEFQETYPPQRGPGAERTTLPGVFLIIVGVANLLMACGSGLIGFTFTHVSHADLQKAYDEQSAKNQQEMKQIGVQGPEDLRNIYVRGGFGAGIVWGLVSLPIILGGILMCMRKGWGLAVFAAILAAIPGLSPSSCPCIFGLGVGIWALVVLFNADVKRAFR
jgi:hypothetical protein